MIRGIIFDCFGVLYHGSLERLRELTPPDRRPELHDLSHSYDYGYITQADYFKGVGLLINRSSGEVGDICRQQQVRNERMIRLVRQLRPNYKVAMLSNVGRGFIEGLFTPEELTALFDAEVLSNEVGMRKPDKEIYDLAATTLGISPNECVVIDDMLLNVTGAVDAGMKGIVCTTTDQTITDLNALLGSQYA